MTGRFIISVFVLFSTLMICRVEAADNFHQIRIHRSYEAVDLDDIINRNNNGLKESDVKRICAEITDRYHEKGYTAFYIKRAELHKDGTADLFFNESAVAEIHVTGAGRRNAEIAGSLFIRGDLFNEYTLKGKTEETKKRFKLKQLHVTVRRAEDGNIILNAEASEKNNEIESHIYNTPVYGVIPEMTCKINYGGILAGISASSSFYQADRSYSRGYLYINSGNDPGRSYFTVSAELKELKDSLRDNNQQFYTHRIMTSAAGYCNQNGALSLMIRLCGTDDRLYNYPACDGGISFAGVNLTLNYDDSLYKIDYGEITNVEIDLSSGWNFIERKAAYRLLSDYVFNFPVYNGFFLSLNGNFFYTTDRERFAGVYVYDQNFPCRSDDFSYARLRNVTGIDIAYEAYKRTLYIFPGFKWGFHNAAERYSNVYAAGVKTLFNAGSVKVEVSYFYDLGFPVKEGFMMFAADTVY